MGRTIPTYRRMLDRLEAEWKDYAAVLRRHEREAFEALWSQARRHAAAATNQAPLEPLDAAVMSVLLEHELRLARLEREVRELQELREGREVVEGRGTGIGAGTGTTGEPGTAETTGTEATEETDDDNDPAEAPPP